MATSARRKERYQTDPEYRQTVINQVTARREARREARAREARLRGWSPIHSVPENEVVLLYDPSVFWPVVASWNGKDWSCVHYEGLIRPTHWRHILPVPLS